MDQGASGSQHCVHCHRAKVSVTNLSVLLYNESRAFIPSYPHCERGNKLSTFQVFPLFNQSRLTFRNILTNVLLSLRSYGVPKPLSTRCFMQRKKISGSAMNFSGRSFRVRFTTFFFLSQLNCFCGEIVLKEKTAHKKNF